MKKIITMILSVSFCMILNSCLEEPGTPFDGVFSVINNSLDTIYYTTRTDEFDVGKKIRLYGLYEIEPNGCSKHEFYIDKINTYLLNIYIWKKSTLERYAKEYIEENEIVDKQYTVDYQDLEKLDFKVVYDGTE